MPNNKPTTKIRSYRDLDVWKMSIDLVTQVYGITDHFPSREMYGIVKQMRRASVSIPSNIAEGQGRRTTGDFIRFVSNAEGSLCELDTQMIISLRLEFTNRNEADPLFQLMSKVRGKLSKLRRSLEERKERTNVRDKPH